MDLGVVSELMQSSTAGPYDGDNAGVRESPSMHVPSHHSRKRQSCSFGSSRWEWWETDLLWLWKEADAVLSVTLGEPPCITAVAVLRRCGER